MTHSSPWNRTPDIRLIAQVLVSDVILRADQDSRRPVTSSRHGYQEIGMLFQRLRIFSNNVVQTQVQLVKGQGLLKLDCNLTGGIVVRVFVVDLQTGKHRVLEANIDTDNVIDECRRLVRLQWRGNGQASLQYKLKNQNKLI